MGNCLRRDSVHPGFAPKHAGRQQGCLPSVSPTGEKWGQTNNNDKQPHLTQVVAHTGSLGTDHMCTR